MKCSATCPWFWGNFIIFSLTSGNHFWLLLKRWGNLVLDLVQIWANRCRIGREHFHPFDFCSSNLNWVFEIELRDVLSELISEFCIPKPNRKPNCKRYKVAYMLFSREKKASWRRNIYFEQLLTFLENGHHPVWNETCEFMVKNLPFAFLRFEVQDEDMFGEPNFIGQAVYPVSCYYLHIYIRNSAFDLSWVSFTYCVIR